VTGATTGDIVTIYRDLPVSRTSDYQTSGDLLAETLNDDFDKTVMMAQQNESSLSLGLRVDQWDDYGDLTLPSKANRVGKVLAFNATTGNPEGGPTIADTDTVAGISADIATVAGISSDVTAVAADATDIGVVAGKATQIGLLGTADAIADMNTLGTADIVADMNTLATADVVADMNTLGTAAIVSDMDLLGTSANVTAMATCSTNITAINAAPTSATNAATSATNAASSATSASSSASTATTQATTATTQASNASTSATSAATSATSATSSATSATSSASTATTQASAASTSATASATSATASASSASAAATSAASAAASLDSFDDKYLGAKSSDPTVDNDGNTLVAGTWYFSTATDRCRIYNGSSWADVALDAATVVSKTSVTGSASLPSGTTAQRDGSPTAGYLRWNTTDTSAEVYDGSAWAAVGGGNSTTEGLYEMANTISANYSITSGNNALTAGPITINSGISVTIPTGSTWVIA
jgi:hypothetical protein